VAAADRIGAKLADRRRPTVNSACPPAWPCVFLVLCSRYPAVRADGSPGRSLSGDDHPGIAREDSQAITTLALTAICKRSTTAGSAWRNAFKPGAIPFSVFASRGATGGDDSTVEACAGPPPKGPNR